jgi:hypothetical protein
MKLKAGGLIINLSLVSVFTFFTSFGCFSLKASPAFYHLSPATGTSVFGLRRSVNDTTHKKDRDHDGIVDSLDKCPDEKGVIQYDGCPVPDSDNDGIADDVDSCPTVAGTLAYKGCPTSDKDGDKISDDEDKCPDEAGVARYNGCPVGDKDGDGINDEDDKCISVPGPAENNGCPIDGGIKSSKKKAEKQ